MKASSPSQVFHCHRRWTSVNADVFQSSAVGTTLPGHGLTERNAKLAAAGGRILDDGHGFFTPFVLPSVQQHIWNLLTRETGVPSARWHLLIYLTGAKR